MKIAVVGAGYVGLVTGACFAELGVKAACIDKDADKIKRLKQGKIPIYEPGLEALVQRHLESGRLEFTESIEKGIKGKHIVFLAVGTPPHPSGDGSADLSHVFAAVKEIATCIDPHGIIVTKSTVPVGTGEAVQKLLTGKPNVEVVSNPEFLREGNAVQDFMQPHRIIIGTDSEYARSTLLKLYKSLTDRGVPLLLTDRVSAELAKYAANSFLAMKVAFINEMADICEKVGGNIHEVAVAIGMDRRIGKDFLNPGPGFGGSCFPKDIQALSKTAADHSASSQLIEAVIESNRRRKNKMAEKIIAACGGSVAKKLLGVLGLAFKANTDDVRESPAIAVIEKLLQAGGIIRCYDPKAMEQAKALLGDRVIFAATAYEALETAEACIILTEWEEFGALDFVKVRDALKVPLLIDLRNLVNTETVKAAGLQHVTLGRKNNSGPNIKSLKRA